MLPAQVLYSEGQLGSEVYSDLISKKAGDLIRVVVVQNAQANQNMQSARNRSAKLDAATEIPAGAGFLSSIPTGDRFRFSFRSDSEVWKSIDIATN